MPLLQRVVLSSASTPNLSSRSFTPVLASSTSFNTAAAAPNTRILSPEEIVYINYFPASESSAPQLGMNLAVRFVRPGRPAAALDVQSSNTLAFAVGNATFPRSPSRERFMFAATRNRSNNPDDSRTRMMLKKLRARAHHLPWQKLSRPSPRVPSDPELAFQDEQHRRHLCWRCRKAGGRQQNCRAFRKPGTWNALTPEYFAA